MKFYNLTDRIKNMGLTKLGGVRWASIVLMGLIPFVISSCSDDDSTDVNPNGDEVASAKILSILASTPNGGITYMGIYEELPSEIDVSNTIEIGQGGSVYSFGENPYTWNGNAGTMTKWVVDRRTLEAKPIGILSLASTGISPGGAAEPVFVSETRAFSHDLSEGLIVEWNPSTMELIEVYDVPVNPYLSSGNFDFTYSNVGYINGDKIVIPVGLSENEGCCSFNSSGGEMIAVFDLNTNTLEYKQDTRNYANDGLLIVDENQDMYSYPHFTSIFNEVYRGSAENHLTILKVNGDGNYDSDFALNLKDVIPIEFLVTAFAVSNNEILLQYVDSSFTWPSNFEDRFNVFFHPNKFAFINFTTNEVREFTGLDGYGFLFYRGDIDGKKYFVANVIDGSIVLLRQNSIDDYTQVTAMSGTGNTIFYVNNLW